MKNIHIILVASLLLSVVCQAQLLNDLKSPLPSDSTVRKGKLPNGLTYYIQHNNRPSNRAELRLVVKAGSNFEDDDQQGLAHFVEHMAFNGTAHFKKNELVNFFETAGMKFGAHLNAYTSFDETVYMLQLPTDSQRIFKKGFLVLEDWAHNLSFDDEEIEKERGVVISERRNRLGAEERMSQKTDPVIYNNSRYSQRMPIGKLDVLQNCKHETLKKFYHDWYRTDLMAVIAVGDFNVDSVEKLIIAQFSGIAPKENPRPVQTYPVPENRSLQYIGVTDKEATQTTIEVMNKIGKDSIKTLFDYRSKLAYNLFNLMLNDRLSELEQLPNPPFSNAYMGHGTLTKTRNVYSFYAIVKEENIVNGLVALLKENQRAKYFGFNDSEYERAKTKLMRIIEKEYLDRDKAESRSLVAPLVRNFLTGEPYPSTDYKFKFYKKYLNTIPKYDLDRLPRLWSSDEGIDMAIVIQAPEKPNVKIPTENDIKTLLRYIPLSELHPYDDNTSTKPLMSRQPRPGKINSQKDINEINTTELNLSNGIKVILKPTNFKNDEISFNAYAPGGSSLVSDNDFLSANFADDIVNASGIGTINNIALKKMLAGKIVTVTPYIDFLRQGFRGNCSPNDLETALQLIHLYFTSPRKDSVAFISFKERLKTTLENRLASPESAFNDTITQTMHNYNQRLRPLTLSALNEINFKRAYEIYKERFSSPGDFTFFFVGNFNTDSIKPLLEKYLGGLPNTSKKETYNDLHISYPKGVIKKTVVAGTEAKSNVHLEYTGNFEYNQKNRLVLNALTRLLSIKLRESIREDKGGTYGVSVYATTNHYPSQDYDLTIHFGCDPKNVKILTDVLFQVINKIKKHGVEDQDLLKVKEIFKREYEVSFRENSFWLGALSNYNYDGENSLDILKLPKIVESITATDLQQAARKYLNKNNYAKFVLMPLKQ